MNSLFREIGQRIQNLRHQCHMTQEDLAEMLNVSVKHISSVERGLSSLSIEKLVQICDELNCSMDYLVRGKEMSDFDSRFFCSGKCGDRIPEYLNELYSYSGEDEQRLFLEYLMMYIKLRKWHPDSMQTLQAGAD